MPKHSLPARSHLFTVRLWLEDVGQGEVEWRGEVKHVASGAERYFRDWALLRNLMLGMVGEQDPHSQQAQQNENEPTAKLIL